MVSPTGDTDAGSSGDVVSFLLQSKDLPSTRLLGKGLSGFGYETIWKGERFARKDFVGVPSKIFVQEAAAIVGLKDHRNIVKTYGWTVDKRSCSLVLEYMDDDLLSLLQKKVESKQDLAGIGFGNQSSTSTSTQSIGDPSSVSTSTQPFDLQEVLDIISQIATGMEYLHEQGIAHGDLKTKNILVTHMNDGDQDSKVVKVTDFGLARTKRKSKSIVSRHVRKLNIVKWKAPEYLKILFRRLNVSNAKDGTSSESNSNSESEEICTPPVARVDVFVADVYCFAVTCSQILTGKDPYPNLDWKDLGDKILSGLRPKLPDACPLLLRNLLISCWGDPAQRPTFSDIHKWFKANRDELLTTGACQEPGTNSYLTPDEHPIETDDEHISIETDYKRSISQASEEISIRTTSSISRTSPTYQFSISAPGTSMKTWLTGPLRHFKTKGSEVNYPSAETPKIYLKFTTECMDRVLRMTKTSTSLKFNRKQCDYVANKLRMAVQTAFLFVGRMVNTWNSKFDSAEDRACSLEIFKLLFALGKEVECFIQSCCKDVWVASAIMLVNVSEHVSSLSFNLDLCTIAFSNSKRFGAIPSLTVTQVSLVWEAEAILVELTANLDELRLYEDVTLMFSRFSKKSRAKWQLATLLLERLQRQRQYTRPAPLEGLNFDKLHHHENLESSLEDIQLLGKGAFGTVHKANWLGTDVATKTFHGPSASDIEQEVTILEGLCHPNIVSLLGYTRNERNCYMIMELMDGSLYSLLRERTKMGHLDCPFRISEAIHIMLQVAEGMLYLHEKRIVHRDLKSTNILIKCLKATQVEVGFVNAKVGGFVQSRMKEHSVTNSPQTPNQGTTRWMAPEVIRKFDMWNDAGMGDGQEEVALKYPFKVDIYSFAMVCFEILTGFVPFHSCPSITQVKQQVLAGLRPKLPHQCPDRLRNLIEACWSFEPKIRPGFGDICAELRHLKYASYIESASVWIRSEEDKGAGLPTEVFKGKGAVDVKPQSRMHGRIFGRAGDQEKR